MVVTPETLGQVVGFFVGDADPQTASTFRDVRGRIEESRDEALEILEAVCETDEEWDRALHAASATVQHAYDDYTETLESMGINPKNVC